MTDLVVIVPSRGRPDAAFEVVQAFSETCQADTYLCFAVDKDDPQAYDYPICITVGDTHNMGQALDWAVRGLISPLVPTANDPFALGFMGDDHRPRTVGWDKAYLDALRDLGTGIVYGDDLLQGENLPTQVVMTADIVRALGFMAPPTLTHMYFDNFWKDLGQRAGCLRYLPDVVVEHMHPVAGKAAWDEGHRRVNAPSMFEKDRIAYTRFCATGGLADAVAKVRALRAVRT